MTTAKEERIYIRIAAEVKDDLEALANFKGLKTATILHSLIVKAIQKARTENSQIFSASKHKNSRLFMEKDSKKLPKNLINSKYKQSNDAQKTFRLNDGTIIPLYKEAVSFDDNEEF